jgi:arsenate reductase
MTDIPEVLFVCTHNAGRSQMAAALLDHEAAGRVRVTSAADHARISPPTAGMPAICALTAP